MHHYHLRLTADLRVDRHGKDEGIVFPVRKVELFKPKRFGVLGTYIAMLNQFSNVGLESQLYFLLTEPGRPGIGWNGGQSSKCQFAGVSTILLGRIAVIGLIQKSAGSCMLVSIHSLLESGA